MIVGIDTSKDFFDAAAIKNECIVFQKKFSNDATGFKSFIKAIEEEQVELVCIEATGPYHLRFALFLVENNLKVSVINPLVIKRYAQMKMSRAKTDKKDAFLIALYGKEQKPEPWKSPDKILLKIKQLDTHLELLSKNITALSNQLHAFKASGVEFKKLHEQIETQIKELKKVAEETEMQIDDLIQSSYKGMATQLKSVPGIGKKSAYLIIICTNGYSTFDNYKQVTSFFGLAPRHYQSGTSVRGRTRICKMGMSRVRKVLYMAAVSSLKCNKPCISLYERLRAKGKSHNSAIVAVMNKLIKQTFAIVKNGTTYQVDAVL